MTLAVLRAQKKEDRKKGKRKYQLEIGSLTLAVLLIFFYYFPMSNFSEESYQKAKSNIGAENYEVPYVNLINVIIFLIVL